jgi:hypothetical protein
LFPGLSISAGAVVPIVASYGCFRSSTPTTLVSPPSDQANGHDIQAMYSRAFSHRIFTVGDLHVDSTTAKVLTMAGGLKKKKPFKWQHQRFVQAADIMDR